ncbi:CvfB family protein [Schwartzia sp. (in: firmicutes)]
MRIKEMDPQEKEVRRYKPGTVEKLKVVRLGEMGAWLDAGTGSTGDDILLHNLQQTAPVAVGDEVEVFLYLDPKRRLTASMRTPKMKEGQIARLKVINVSRDGAFLDVGAERGIFMPYAGMRGRPQIGEVVWAKLYTDKSGRLAVTMEVEDEMRRASKPANDVKVGSFVTGQIYNYTDSGAFLFSEEHYIVFIDNKEMKDRPRVGATVTARVTYVRKDGRLNASLREIKEKAMTSDGDVILRLLRERHGKMPYSDSTSPEVIKDKFQISKSAFKRALGHLMKQGLVEERDGWTYLKEESDGDASSK